MKTGSTAVFNSQGVAFEGTRDGLTVRVLGTVGHKSDGVFDVVPLTPDNVKSPWYDPCFRARRNELTEV